MKRFAMACIIVALCGSGCSDSPRNSGYIEEQPHTNTGTGGIGSGPTGTGGSEPADVRPATP